MKLCMIDWCILILFFAGLTIVARYTNRFLKSVADFLVANRCAGRYILSIAGGATSFGTISAIASFEMYYKAGVVPLWWQMMLTPVTIIIAMTGWGIYRYRQTRCMTIQQFLEMRYSKRFRIFCGSLCYLSGILNMGIFPAVSAHFFIYFCGFPATFELFGIQVSTFVFIMLIQIIFAVYFTLAGGQITIMVTDFIQGIFMFLAFIVIIIYLMTHFNWIQMSETLSSMSQENASLLNPFKTRHIQDFNIWYYLIAIYGAFWNRLSWQGSMGYQGAAKTPHEAKMSGVISDWRGLIMIIFVVMMPVFILTLMHHPGFAAQAQSVNAELDTIDNEITKFQMIVPVALSQILPRGLMGLMVTVMMAALLSTHNTYLHSWGSILVQDVIVPLRKKPLTLKQHLFLLRASILFVSIFIFIFSLLWQQTEHILLYMAITGAIFMGGAGTVIIGGLYWSKGSTAAAWCAMIIGSTMAVGGMVMQQLERLEIIPVFPINGQWMFLLSMFTSQITYFLVSLFGKTKINMDKLLHRGKYAVIKDIAVGDLPPARGWRVLLTMGKEFSHRDRILYIATFVWHLFWSTVFVVGTIYNLTHDVSDQSWIKFWKIYLLVYLIIGVAVTVWVGIGGIRDMKDLFCNLSTIKRDADDDGTVECPDEYKEIAE